MVFSGNGNVKLLEAVDELGQSLTSTASDDERTFGPRGMAVGLMMDGPVGNLTIHLHRPESPGKLIKTLRGTVDASVTSPRSNPLVIPLEGAEGKTFQNGDQRVVVNSIATDPTRGQGVIELKFDDLDEVFPEEPVSGAGGGGPCRDDGPELRTTTRIQSVPVGDPDPHIKRPVPLLPDEDRSGLWTRDARAPPDEPDEPRPRRSGSRASSAPRRKSPSNSMTFPCLEVHVRFKGYGIDPAQLELTRTPKGSSINFHERPVEHSHSWSERKRVTD